MKYPFRKVYGLLLLVLLLSFADLTGNSPLRIHPRNFHYVTDDSGRAIVLSGSHTWLRKTENGQCQANGWNLEKFNKYLDFLKYWNHNFVRLWMWEQEGDINIWVKWMDGKYDLTENAKYI